MYKNMMNQNRAFFISATVFVYECDEGEWTVDRDIANSIFDWASRGYLLVVVFYAKDYMNLEKRNNIKERLNAAFKKYCNFEIPNFKVMFIANLEDPEPFWEVRRCWGLNMGQSILVAETEAGNELAKIIEVGEFSFWKDFCRW